MYRSSLSALAFSITCAYAYENSSPLFIYSTSNLNFPSISNIASASAVENALFESTKLCPTNNYLVVSQPGVSADDFSNSRSAPLLSERLATTSTGQTSIQIRDVVDTLDLGTITKKLSAQCSRSVLTLDTSSLMIPGLQVEPESKVFYTELPTLGNELSTTERHVLMLQHDTYLSSLIDLYFKNKDYTLVYATTSVHAAKNSLTASEKSEYKAELPLADMMHSGELRRSLAERQTNSTGNQTIIDGPLFDKYQFLSPGIFMGLFVGFILLSILYVGISALSSLQVTYGAFDKDQGQLAGKKQQ